MLSGINIKSTGTYPDFVILAHDEPSLTRSGNTAASTWNLRPINTIRYNRQTSSTPWLSLSSNQFTLQPGKYFIEAYAAVWRSNRNQMRVFNVTDGTNDILGMSGYSFPDSNFTTNTILVKGELSPTSPKTYEINHWTTASKSPDGLGISFGGITPVTETYLLAMITKLE